MQIGKISLHTAQAAEKVSSPKNENSASGKLSSNPFGVSFKGNVIQADVFQSSAKKAASGLGEKGRLFLSAAASGINCFNEAFKARMNAAAAFCKKITSNIFDRLDKIGSTEIKFDAEGIKDKLFPDRSFEKSRLLNMPVSEIGAKWRSLAAPSA